MGGVVSINHYRLSESKRCMYCVNIGPKVHYARLTIRKGHGTLSNAFSVSRLIRIIMGMSTSSASTVAALTMHMFFILFLPRVTLSERGSGYLVIFFACGLPIICIIVCNRDIIGR